MFRLVLCLVLLMVLIASGGSSWADTFRCTRPDGSVFLTNDPSQVPKDCTVERVTDLPPLGVLPDSPVKSPPTPVAEGSVPAQTKGGERGTYESFAGEAVQLAERYRAARRSQVTSSFASDQLKARRELADIRGQANALRQEIDRSKLSGSEKRKLDELLSPITE